MVLLTHWGCPMSNWLYNFVQLIDVGGGYCALIILDIV